MRINAKHHHTALKEKKKKGKNRRLHLLLTHSCPSFSKTRLCLRLFSLIPYRLKSPRLLPKPPARHPARHPSTPHLPLLFPCLLSSRPIFPAVIPLLLCSRTQLIGHVHTVTWGPDIIAGQIVRRSASDLSRRGCVHQLTGRPNYRRSSNTC